LESENQREYLERCIDKASETKPISNYFKKSSKGLVDLISQMLAFNPNERISAKQALESAYFDDIRIKSAEVESSKKIYLNCDCADFRQDLTKKEMRLILSKESLHYSEVIKSKPT
jgi:serine/threonine protein kinase